MIKIQWIKNICLWIVVVFAMCFGQAFTKDMVGVSSAYVNMPVTRIYTVSSSEGGHLKTYLELCRYDSLKGFEYYLFNFVKVKEELGVWYQYDGFSECIGDLYDDLSKILDREENQKFLLDKIKSVNFSTEEGKKILKYASNYGALPQPITDALAERLSKAKTDEELETLLNILVSNKVSTEASSLIEKSMKKIATQVLKEKLRAKLPSLDKIFTEEDYTALEIQLKNQYNQLFKKKLLSERIDIDPLICGMPEGENFDMKGFENNLVHKIIYALLEIRDKRMKNHILDRPTNNSKVNRWEWVALKGFFMYIAAAVYTGEMLIADSNYHMKDKRIEKKISKQLKIIDEEIKNIDWEEVYTITAESVFIKGRNFKDTVKQIFGCKEIKSVSIKGLLGSVFNVFYGFKLAESYIPYK